MYLIVAIAFALFPAGDNGGEITAIPNFAGNYSNDTATLLRI
jgi:hypothetical protein